MEICQSVMDVVGGTPIVRLTRSCEGLNANVYAKVEYVNPAGSVKDRVAKEMIENIERMGGLREGGTLIEPTSGNTGIGLCAIAAAKGYKAVIVMPDNMSKERIMLMKAYGAEVVLTSGARGMKGAIERAEALCRRTPNSFVLGQFNNPANPRAHYKTTGPEIWEDMDGKVDIFVAGIGTGGTVSGVGKYLKEKKKNVHVVGVEPSSSPFLTEGKAGAHGIQGIGAGFKPEVLDTSVVDQIIAVSDEDAILAAKELARKEGLLVGISSGAAFVAAKELAKLPQNAEKNIVVLLPDTGERYLSTPLFEG